MSDYIKRDDVLALAKDIVAITIGGEYRHRWIDPDCVREIPSADVVERKKGKWTDHSGDGYVECPFCDSATNCDGNIEELHFCFSCGAEMESE